MRGNLWNLEVFYKKTSPVTPYFYSYNILSELMETPEKKWKNATEENFSSKNVLFSTFAKNPLRRIFFKIIVFPKGLDSSNNNYR